MHSEKVLIPKEQRKHLMSKKYIARVTRSKNDAIQFYNKISRIYDVSEGFFERKYIQKGVDQLSVQGDTNVLEIGVGTGESELIFARHVGPSGKVYGVDIARGMLQVTEKKLKEKNLNQYVELICADAVYLPFQERFFDSVFLSFTLELFDTPDIPRVLSECFRVLKNNGRLEVVSLSKKNYSTIVKMYEWLHTIFPRMLDCRPIYVTEALQDAGFRIMNSSVVSMWGLSVEIVLGGVTKSL